VLWERKNPPTILFSMQFDDAAEDEAVAGHN
jgi:hypothetical protein